MTRSPQRGRGGRVTGFGEPTTNLRLCLLPVCLNQNIIDKTPVSARIHSGAVRGWPSVALAKHFYEGDMQQFSKTEILSLSAKICDRCGRRAELDNPEFQEYLSIDRVAGYGSAFGDGERIG